MKANIFTKIKLFFSKCISCVSKEKQNKHLQKVRSNLTEEEVKKIIDEFIQRSECMNQPNIVVY